MACHYWICVDEKTHHMLTKIVSKFFVPLKKAKFLITFRDKEKTDDEGNIIAAEAIKISAKPRDLFGYDFEICIDSDIWAKADKMTKYRILYHELRHCGVETEEGSSEPKYDDNNRLKTYMIKHNLWLKTFKEEVEIFGFDGADKDVAEFMSEMLESRDKIKLNKKDFMAKLGIEIHVSADSTKKKKVKKQSAEELEEEADRLLGLKKKKKKKKVTEIAMSTEKKKKRSVDEDDEED